MAEALDTACLDFIAHNETASIIEMPLPGKNMGQLLTGLATDLVVRRLIELGALKVVSDPYISYAWTHDGRRMIDHVNMAHPRVLGLLRQHKNEA